MRHKYTKSSHDIIDRFLEATTWREVAYNHKSIPEGHPVNIVHQAIIKIWWTNQSHLNICYIHLRKNILIELISYIHRKYNHWGFIIDLLESIYISKGLKKS